ncbi:hypothetical protein [Streptomyces sp. NPDC001657]|uniref:hypothetical protein n=1 Tax=Streptomyces sp. NPDC001657 TaxID=3154522 RepID=UPI00331E59FC
MSAQDRKDANRAEEVTEKRMMGVAENFDKAIDGLALKDRTVEKGCEEKAPNLDPNPADAPEVNCKVKITSTYSTRLSPAEVVCAARKHPEVVKWSPPKHGVCGEADYVSGDTHLIETYRMHNVSLNWTPRSLDSSPWSRVKTTSTARRAMMTSNTATKVTGLPLREKAPCPGR